MERHSSGARGLKNWNTIRQLLGSYYNIDREDAPDLLSIESYGRVFKKTVVQPAIEQIKKELEENGSSELLNELLEFFEGAVTTGAKYHAYIIERRPSSDSINAFLYPLFFAIQHLIGEFKPDEVKRIMDIFKEERNRAYQCYLDAAERMQAALDSPGGTYVKVLFFTNGMPRYFRLYRNGRLAAHYSVEFKTGDESLYEEYAPYANKIPSADRNGHKELIIIIDAPPNSPDIRILQDDSLAFGNAVERIARARYGMRVFVSKNYLYRFLNAGEQVLEFRHVKKRGLQMLAEGQDRQTTAPDSGPTGSRQNLAAEAVGTGELSAANAKGRFL